MQKKNLLLLLVAFGLLNGSNAQRVLTLKEAVETAVKNYGSVKAKEAYVKSAQAAIEQAKRDNLPNINFGLQQDFGTINGQNGPLYGFGGLSVASAGPSLPEQNWNAAFGSLYLTNVNWDFFAFGRAKEHVKVARSAAEQYSKDLSQEIFQHKIKVAAAYLNLQAAQQLSYSYRRNLERIDTVRHTVITKAVNGLVAGVDSSLANADYANALITYTRSIDNVQQEENTLSFLMGVDTADFVPDSISIAKIPAYIADTVALENHPQLLFYKSRILASEQQKKYLKTFYYPAFSIAGVLQTRGSGFGNNYVQNQKDYSSAYWDGIKPTRTNYLFGIGVTWNITTPYRLSQQVKSQDYITQGLQKEYSLAEKQLRAQLQLAETRWRNALTIYSQAPTQLKAAGDAYIQRSTLYKNGLTDMVDLSQAIYALVRAETDKDVAGSNVWQALLLKAAATGDFSLFENQF